MATERNVNEIQIKYRRLDSLALLIQGNETCGAVYFHSVKKYLFVATNKSEYYLARELFNRLKDIAQSAKEKKIRKEKFCRKHTIKSFIRKSSFLEYAKKNIDLLQESLIFAETEARRAFKKNFEDAFEKIVRSIVYAYLRPNSERALPDLAKAIIKNRIIYIADTNYKKVHAELKIIQHLVDKEYLLSLSGTIYIGISKKCCKNCTTAIEALNNVMRHSLIYNQFLVDKRGDHYNLYPSQIPTFLRQFTADPNHPLESLEYEFCRLAKVTSLEKAFHSVPSITHKEAQSRSASENKTSESPRLPPRIDDFPELTPSGIPLGSAANAARWGSFRQFNQVNSGNSNIEPPATNRRRR